MGKPENIVENYLRTQARKYGCLCYKFTSPGNNGVPDEILIYKGKTIFIETKSDTGTPSEIQKLRIKEMINHGADVRICHTRQAIDEVLKELIKNYKPLQPTTTSKVTPITIRQKKIKNPLCDKKT